MTGLRVAVLGPIAVDRDSVPIRLGPRQTALLCVLLLANGRSVPAARLIEMLWGPPAPAGALATLRSHVSHLRRALDPQRASGPERTRRDSVITTSGIGSTVGYQLNLAPECLDVHDFEQDVARGRTQLADDPEAAAALIGAALARWRGPAYAEVRDRPFALAEVARLQALHQAARRAYAEALLALGRHAEVIPDLTEAITHTPYDEGLRRMLALSLYQAHRVHEAAEVCREGLRLLRDRGHDAPDLEELQRRILRRTVSATTPAPRRSPCLLPAPPARLLGRADELAEAGRWLRGPRDRPVSLLVTGPAGAGKTAFAVRVGYAAADAFPDGQLFAELQHGPAEPPGPDGTGGTGGAGGTGGPVEPGVVLDGFLRALGIPAAEIPRDTGQRVQLYRSLLAHRRVLVVLDDAANPAQVRDLLPSGPQCAAVVTSRTRLTGLDGIRLPLGALGTDPATTLLEAMVGEARLTAEPQAARAIVRACDRLPLAVWVAGARLAARPHRRLGELARALADEHRRLDELVVADVAVRASVELTYRRLPDPIRRALRRLGLLPAREFTPWVLAVLLDTALPYAERTLDGLIEVHLVEPSSAEHYRLPELVRLFARERAYQEDDRTARESALRRLAAVRPDLSVTTGARSDADLVGAAAHRPHR